jgi:predicted Zn-dependent peptidase
MKNKKLFQKFVFIALIVAVLSSLVAPASLSQALPAPKQEKLLNGLKVLMWSDARADKVSVKIRIHSGSAFDPQGKEGLMQMLADNIFPNEASREFFTEDLGGSLEVIANYDFIQINASSKPESFLTMLETLSTAVSNPTIDKETTVKLRNALLAKVTALEGDPEYVADIAVAKRLFGTFPYGRPQLGTADSLKKIDFADLIDARQRFVTADNATITVSGNFDRTLGFRAIRRYFGGWLKADKTVPATFRQPDEPPVGLQIVTSPKPGISVIRFAWRGVSRSEKDLAASFVFSTILENRLKASASAAHASDVFVRNEPHTLPGMIVIEFSTAKNFGGNVKSEANDLVSKAMSEPITETEFQNAKNSVQSAWSKRESTSIWLDADTYKLSGVDADIRLAERVTYSEFNAYVEKTRKLPMVTVLVNTPQAE